MIRRLAALAGVVLATLTFAVPAHAATAADPVAVSRARPARMAVEASAVVAVSSYQVVSGDTLGAIAARFCGTFSAYPGLAAASGIANPDLIFPGQVIRLSGCHGDPSSAAPKPATSSSTAPAPPAPSSSSADRVVAFALAQVGKPYVWAAAGPYGFDCSGLVMAAYAQVGIRLPHLSYAMINYGVPVSRNALRPGDVIWPYASLGHVVIYIGGDRIVEAPYPGASVQTNGVYGFYAARRYL